MQKQLVFGLMEQSTILFIPTIARKRYKQMKETGNLLRNGQKSVSCQE